LSFLGGGWVPCKIFVKFRVPTLVKEEGPGAVVT
jgi:hypothetical protein